MAYKKTLLTLFLGVVTTTLSAQTTIVKGELLDSLSREGEPFVTVRIFKGNKKDKPVEMLVTDEFGKFTQEVKGQGKYLVTFTALGRKDIEKRINLSGKDATIDLGVLLLQNDEKMMEGVTVVAQKPLVKMETDKMTYAVEDDVDAKAKTVLDMLRKVPMVVVDGQDNITVNGSGSFKVYVDGKPNVMFSSNPSQIFKSMPATSVKSIEVITNPGAKYDAEGTGGVLNIIMNKAQVNSETMNGYNGNISATMTNYGPRTSAFLSGQKGKFTYNTNIMVNSQNVSDVEVLTERVSKDGSTMQTQQRAESKNPFLMGTLSMGYEIDSLSNLGATIGITNFGMKSESHPMNSFFGGVYGSGFSYGNQMMTKSSTTTFNGSVDYHRFLNQARTSSITLSYLFTTTPGTTENERRYDPLPASVTIPLTDLYSDAKTRATEHTFQADYTTDLSKTQTFNAGVKFISRKNSSDSKYYDVIGGKQIYDQLNSVNYKNTQSILASYVEYKITLGKFGAKAGARYEHTWQDVKYIVGAGDNFKTNYGNLVPSASFSYNLTPTMNIGINYNMRISRPGISYMNPYVDRSNATMLSYGNPDLEVEKSHNFGLVFNSFSPKFMVNLTLDGNIAGNEINQYSFMKDNLMHTTYGNIVRNKNLGLSTFMNYALTTKTRLMLNGDLSYVDVRSKEIGAVNHGWTLNAFFGVQQTLPYGVNLSIFTGGRTKSIKLQGYGQSFNMITATANKSFLKDKLDVSLSYFMPFGGKFRMNDITTTPDFTYSMKTIVPIKYVGLTLTWKFGNTNKRFDQHKSKISNDFEEKKQESNMGVGMGM